ncbi:hypothetical protein GX51_00618 [Blastomyces parvus]|uniref:Uncharacterized protein n=1 Tax=Blastomyces parvus TaxID=2060905 RepID=A0A2B7XL52_9EURO|nr:hypothetical protein GX51_00618 [Blastomyces parvus]
MVIVSGLLGANFFVVILVMLIMSIFVFVLEGSSVAWRASLMLPNQATYMWKGKQQAERERRFYDDSPLTAKTVRRGFQNKGEVSARLQRVLVLSRK